MCTCLYRPVHSAGLKIPGMPYRRDQGLVARRAGHGRFLGHSDRVSTPYVSIFMVKNVQENFFKDIR
jgi:hypothetical protein